MQMRSLTAVLLLTLFATSLPAQEAFDANMRAAAIAPYIDELTVGVVHVDFRRFEAQATLRHASDKFGIAGPSPTEMERITKLQTEAKRIAPELYVVVSLADVPRDPPACVVRIGKGAKAVEIIRLFMDLVEPNSGVPDEELRKFDFEKDGWLVIGGERTLARLKKLKPVPAADLARAFEVAGDTACQAIVMLTDSNRPLVSGLIGTLPPPFEEVNSRELAKSARFAALGIDLPPRPQIRLGVQAADESGANKLHSVAVSVLDLLKRPGIIPQAKDAIPLLTPQKKGDRLYLVLRHEKGDFDALAKAFEPVIASVRTASQRQQSMRNLRQINSGLINYEAGFGRFPTQAIRSKDGKPLLSWRVAILPYIEELELYNEFKLDQSWDSEHNKKLIDKMPAIYMHPSGVVKAKGHTLYMAPICKGSILASEQGMKVAEVTDGTSRTVMIVEANPDKAVVWTKPDDLNVDLEKPLVGLGDIWNDGILVCFCDDHTALLKPAIDPETVRRLFQANDGKDVDPDAE